MRLPDKSANSLIWLAVFLLIPGLMIQSPSGRFFFVALSGLVALVPMIFGNAKRRVFAGVVATISLLIVIGTYEEFCQDQDSYRERARQKLVPPGSK